MPFRFTGFLLRLRRCMSPSKSGFTTIPNAKQIRARMRHGGNVRFNPESGHGDLRAKVPASHSKADHSLR